MATKKKYKAKAQAGRKKSIIPSLATNPYIREEDLIVGVDTPMPEQQQQTRQLNPVQEGIHRGIIEPPRQTDEFYGYDPTIDVAQEAYDFSQQKGNGRLVENPYVKDFNILATTATGVGNFLQNNRLKNQERLQAMLAQEPTYWENMDAEGLNNIPMYTKYGGGRGKYKTGGGVSVAKAKEILRDGTINGEPLTEKQKNYFGWIAGGSKPRKQTGGSTAQTTQQTQQTATPQRRRLSPGEMQQWNMFLDYVKDKGYEGSEDLNKKNKNLGASLFADFKKANPNIAIDYSIVPDVQNEMQMLGESARAFAKRRNDPNADKLMTGVSPVDGWFGSKTSQYRFPEQQTVVYNNGQLVSQTNDGLLTSNLTATGVPNKDASGNVTSTLPVGTARRKQNIPKGVTVEKLQDGYYYEDPQTGDLVKVEMKYGGGRGKKSNMIYCQTGGDAGIPVITGLPEDMADFANVEAEAGEIVEGQDGNIVKISDREKRHEQGGVDLANVSRVLEDTSTKRKDKASKALQITPEVAEDMLGVKIKRPVSHAKAFELSTDKLEKKQKEYQKSTKNANLVDELTKTGVNTMELNAMFESMLPTTDDIFNLIYDHQEAVKESHNINDDGSTGKYGGKYKGKRKAQAGLGTYSGGRTKAGSVTPTGNPNAFAFPGGLDAYKAAWNPLLNLDQYGSVSQAQAATYDYLVKNQPDVAASIWENQGLTAKGRQLIQSDPNFAAVASQVFDNNGKLKPGVKLTPEQLAALQPAYADNMLGIRAITPSQLTTTQEETYPKTTTQVPGPVQQQQGLTPGVTINPRITRTQNNDFFEPTYLSDIASPLISLADSMVRDPELYNPVEFNQLRLKQVDPTAAMNANQADFNAAAEQIGDLGIGSGSAAANIANLAGQKYRVNNQIQAQYDNQNAGIKNQEIQYNTQVRDKQSVANAKTRDDFYRNVQLSRENQRLQRLKSIEDLARVDQMKRRQNRSGNLVMKLSPAFDQYGEYNGYQYMPILPPDLGVGYTMNQAVNNGKAPVRQPASRTSTTTTFKTADGRVIKKTTR